MLYEVDIVDAPARFAELIETVEAGYGVLIKRGEVIVCRLAPESAFAATVDEDADLTAEQRDAKEVLAMFQSAINDSF